MSEKEKWIVLNEGKRRLYVFTHPDPALHERFSIERVILQNKKTPSFIVVDKLGCVRRLHHDRLLDAKKMVKDTIHIESIDPDIRISVISAYKRDNPEDALIAIIDHFEKRILEESDRFKRKFETLKHNLRNLTY